MVHVLVQAELVLEDVGAAGRVEHPAALHRRARPLLALGVGDGVDLVAEVHLLDARVAAHVGSGRCRTVPQFVLEHAAVDVVQWYLGEALVSELDSAGDVAVAVGREEEAHAVLRDVNLVEVVAQPEHLAEVDPGDTREGLSDLERRSWCAPVPLLEYQHARLRTRLAQLQCEREAGQATPQNHHVVARVRHVRPPSLGPPLATSRCGPPAPGRRSTGRPSRRTSTGSSRSRAASRMSPCLIAPGLPAVVERERHRGRARGADQREVLEDLRLERGPLAASAGPPRAARRSCRSALPSGITHRSIASAADARALSVSFRPSVST